MKGFLFLRPSTRADRPCGAKEDSGRRRIGACVGRCLAIRRALRWPLYEKQAGQLHVLCRGGRWKAQAGDRRIACELRIYEFRNMRRRKTAQLVGNSLSSSWLARRPLIVPERRATRYHHV